MTAMTFSPMRFLWVAGAGPEAIARADHYLRHYIGEDGLALLPVETTTGAVSRLAGVLAPWRPSNDASFLGSIGALEDHVAGAEPDLRLRIASGLCLPNLLILHTRTSNTVSMPLLHHHASIIAFRSPTNEWHPHPSLPPSLPDLSAQAPALVDLATLDADKLHRPDADPIMGYVRES